jgi:hypothetical protein
VAVSTCRLTYYQVCWLAPPRSLVACDGALQLLMAVLACVQCGMSVLCPTLLAASHSFCCLTATAAAAAATATVAGAPTAAATAAVRRDRGGGGS